MPSYPPHHSALARLFRPRAVAVVGASDDFSKYGGRVLTFLIRHGYSGRVIPVNPTADYVQGLRAYPSLVTAGKPADVAVVAVPPSQVSGAVEDATKAGVPFVVILTASFAETGEQGKRAEGELVATVRGGQTRLLGPNCLGYVSPSAHLVLSPSFAFDTDELRQGSIGLVTQSGAVMATTFNRANDAGIGFSGLVSVGNQADLDLCDVVAAYVADPNTRAICVHAEGFREFQRFLSVADDARREAKPLLLLKGGRTSSGARAALTHTASLVGDDLAFEAACLAHGVTLMDDADAMALAAHALVRWPRAVGDIAVVSNSGGHAVLTADRVQRSGRRLAALGPVTKRELKALLPVARESNPLDVGGMPRGTGPAVMGKALEVLQRDPAVGSVLVPITTTTDIDGLSAAAADVVATARKPIIVAFVPGSAADRPRSSFAAGGLPYVDRIDDGLRVLTALQMADPVVADVDPGAPPVGFPAVLPLHAGASPSALLAMAGMRVPDTRMVRSQQAAVAAAEELGYPVVAKLISGSAVHKSDIGAVVLHLGKPTDVEAAWDKLSGIALSMGEENPAVEMQHQILDAVELLIGAVHDPVVGATVTVGSGGILVELLRDIQVAPAPVSAATAQRLLERLRIWPVLEGYRGGPAFDFSAAADAIVRLSWLATRLGQSLKSLEVNPLMVLPRKGGVLAVDIRVETSSSVAPGPDHV